jgi:farnesol dehydrogenase
MTTMLVTGATGFVGRHVTRRLVGEGHRTRVLVRDPSRLDPSLKDRVDVVIGDVCDRRALAHAVDGIETVLHLAALAKPHTRNEADFADVNTAAVSTLMQEAGSAGVNRVVHVSTWLVTPPDRAAVVGRNAQRSTPYESSKLAGELAIQAWVAGGHDAVIVRPTRIYGPGPLHEANGATKLIDLYLTGRLRVRLNDGGALANWVHVDDVAAGVLAAARRGRTGAAYVLGGPENVTLLEYLALAADLAGVPRRRLLPLPPALGVAFARASVRLGGFGGIPAITPGWVRTFLESRTADIEPARRDLGYAPRTLREGLAGTVAWLTGGDRTW